MNEKKIAFLVISCDAYSDLWDIYIETFERFWVDCPFDKYFMSNHKEISSPSFINIKVGDDATWSSGVIKAVSSLKEKYDYVFLTLEDCIILKTIDTEYLLSVTSEFLHLKGNYLKYINKPKRTSDLNPYFGIIDKGSLYRATCVYTLWNIDSLLSLLYEPENAWQFERYGSVRSDNYNRFYVVNKSVFSYSNAVIKGKWVRSEVKRLKMIGVSISLKERSQLSALEELSSKARHMLFTLFNVLLPWKYRRTIVFFAKGLSLKKQKT